MTRDQQAARVNVSDDEWIEFRTLAMRKRRSVADYLGELVRRELGGSQQRGVTLGEAGPASPTTSEERPPR